METQENRESWQVQAGTGVAVCPRDVIGIVPDGTGAEIHVQHHDRIRIVATDWSPTRIREALELAEGYLGRLPVAV